MERTALIRKAVAAAALAALPSCLLAQEWGQKASLPFGVAEVGVAELGGKVYSIGGTEKDGSRLDWASTLNLIYDPGPDRWTKGAPLPLGRSGVVAVPTGTGVSLVQVVSGAQPALTLLSDPLLGELGVARLAGDSEQVVGIRPDKKVQLLAWQADHLVRRWAVSLPTEAGMPAFATIAAEQVLIADDQGSVFVLGRSDGQVLRCILHGAPLTAAPLLVDGRVVVADREGRVSAYRLTPR